MTAGSRTAMGDYEDVNREIHNFLVQKKADRHSTQQTAHASPDILHLLESLNRTYGDINAYLKSGNAEALKDTILKSDIKMSLVCETLLDTLKATTESKNQLAAENSKLSATRREMEEREAQLRLRVDQLERDLECRNADVRELSRVIQDQKDRMNEYRDETQRARSDAAVNRTKVQELENLRAKATERLQVYEREMEAIKLIIKEREERIVELVREKRAEEDKNSSIKIRIAECEKMVEVMNKKMESKDLNLSLCNDELSKVLAENKMMKTDFEKHKERGAYYEGLYSSLSKQNAYLNAQLNKMLREAEYSKDGAAFIRKYRRKNRKRKKTIRSLREENVRLKREAAGVADATCVTTVGSESSEAIIKRIEELTEANRELRKQVAEAEGEKRKMENRLHRLEGDGRRRSEYQQMQAKNVYDSKIATRAPPHPDKQGAASGANIYFGGRTPCVADGAASNAVGQKWGGEAYGAPSLGRDYKSDYIAPDRHTGTIRDRGRAFHEMFSSPSGVAPLMPELRGRAEEYPKPNLYNNYDDAEITGIPGGFADDTFAKQPEELQPLPYPFPAENNAVAGVPTLFGAGNAAPRHVGPKATVPRAPTGVHFGAEEAPLASRVRHAGSAVKEVAEEHSVDSIKSYHTTSTLKDMIARTDKLQRRFESLEEQLAHIKEGNTEERLVDKMRTYSTHCSELNIDSDSDFI